MPARTSGAGWSTLFVVDELQGGAGTCTNMNANEVIANVRSSCSDCPPGATTTYTPRPRDRSQSTNDVCPTVLRLSLLAALDGLSDVMRMLAESCQAKSRQF